MNNLYIFHYHYIKGGVSTVVRNIVKSLKDAYKITLFGSKKNGDRWDRRGLILRKC